MSTTNTTGGLSDILDKYRALGVYVYWHVFSVQGGRAPRRGLLVLGTYRPGYQPAWLAKSYATQLSVPPLAAQDSVQVVQAVLQQATVPPPLAAALLAKAQGNPFFLEELAQTLVEQDGGPGATTRQSSRQGPALPELQLPPTVQAVLAARIDHLAPEAKHLLQIAAVVGMGVPVPLLQAIAGVPEQACASLCQALNICWL